MAKLKLETIRSLVEPLSSIKERWATDTRTAFDRTQTNIERLAGKVSELEDLLLILSPFASGPRLVVKPFFLTDDLEVPIPSEQPGTVILYIFRQDSTGLHIVTWPSPPFIGMFPTAVGIENDSISGYIFSKESENEILPILTGISSVE